MTCLVDRLQSITNIYIHRSKPELTGLGAYDAEFNECTYLQWVGNGGTCNHKFGLTAITAVTDAPEPPQHQRGVATKHTPEARAETISSISRQQVSCSADEVCHVVRWWHSAHAGYATG